MKSAETLAPNTHPNRPNIKLMLTAIALLEKKIEIY